MRPPQHNAPLDDVNARLALNHATDRTTLIDVVLFGLGSEATTFMPRGSLFWNDQLPGFPYDVAKAKDYLAMSKMPDGFKITFTKPVDQATGRSTDSYAISAFTHPYHGGYGGPACSAPAETRPW